MELPPTVYLRKRWPEQAFWDYARVRRDVPHALRCLADQDRIFMGPEGARRVLDYLRGLGFENDATDNHMMPVKVVDYDGNPVSLTSL